MRSMNRFASMTSGRSRVALNLPAALLGLALILLGPDRAWAEPAQGPCVTLNEGTGSYAVCEVDLRRYRLQFFWKGPNGEPYGDLGTLARALEASGRPPVFVTNGGMYKTDLSPVGLYVQDGHELVRANVLNGPGHGASVRRRDQSAREIEDVGRMGQGLGDEVAVGAEHPGAGHVSDLV